MSEQKKPKRAAMPVFVVLKDSISTKDIRRMERLAHICVVESSAPQSARFLDTPPTSDIQAQASAAERQERARPMKRGSGETWCGVPFENDPNGDSMGPHGWYEVREVLGVRSLGGRP